MHVYIHIYTFHPPKVIFTLLFNGCVKTLGQLYFREASTEKENHVSVLRLNMVVFFTGLWYFYS